MPTLKIDVDSNSPTAAINANNRPVGFTKTEGENTTEVECSYNSMGRRYMKKMKVNATVTLHHRYIYRSYLQIACCDLKRSAHPCLWMDHLGSNGTRSHAPASHPEGRHVVLLRSRHHQERVELFSSSGYISTAYDYMPYGGVTEEGDVVQLVQWSNEMYDAELAMVYDNFRHYNPMDGRWINRDSIAEEGGWNLYALMRSNLTTNFDWLGNAFYGVQTIPQILRKNSFFDSARFVDHWFASTGETLYENLDKLLNTARVKEKDEELLTSATN